MLTSNAYNAGNKTIGVRGGGARGDKVKKKTQNKIFQETGTHTHISDFWSLAVSAYNFAILSSLYKNVQHPD